MTEIVVNLPEFHPSQVEAYLTPARFLALRAGRRWGKTKFVSSISVDAGLKAQFIGWFAPEHKFLIEPYAEMVSLLGDAVHSSSEMKGQINVLGGGKIDVWSLDNPLAGRGRKYHGVIVDEAAFAKPQLREQWRRNIRPTLVDYRGWAIVASNTNGIDTDNFFWQICNQPEHGFKQYHAPTSSNPHISAEELAELKSSAHPLVWKQEYEAEFVDWSGVAFFSVEKLLVDGHPAVLPPVVDAVFCTIDSATKTGKLNDGTGVIYWAYVRHAVGGPKLYALDYDLIQIEGALLETWIPNVFRQLQEFALKHRSRNGSLGAFIEDKSSGTILLQQMQRKNMPARAIDSKLTAMGKSERALSVSGYVHREMVKFTQDAFDRSVTYKGVTRNHLLAQVTGFRVGTKEEPNAQDDLLDDFTYGIALAHGNSGGF